MFVSDGRVILLRTIRVLLWSAAVKEFSQNINLLIYWFNSVPSLLSTEIGHDWKKKQLK